jgi:molybdenum-dependent DNA-binding transcriptional regulator ModE
MTNQTQLFNKIKADGLLLRKEVTDFLQKQSHRSVQQRECVNELAALHQKGSLSKAAQEMLLHYALRH